MFCSGKSESITITNKNGPLSKEDIEHMVCKAEDFASEGEVNHKCVEALDSLSSFVYGLKSQLGDQSGLGGKLSDENKKVLLSTIKEAVECIKDNGQVVGTDDFPEEKQILLPLTIKGPIVVFTLTLHLKVFLLSLSLYYLYYDLSLGIM